MQQCPQEPSSGPSGTAGGGSGEGDPYNPDSLPYSTAELTRPEYSTDTFRMFCFKVRCWQLGCLVGFVVPTGTEAVVLCTCALLHCHCALVRRQPFASVAYIVI